MYYAGRFISGASGGAFSIVTPLYTAEVGEKTIRGALGTYYEFMLAVGVEFSYIIGGSVSVFWLCIICGIVPIVFGILFSFMPESPYYYVAQVCFKIHEIPHKSGNFLGPNRGSHSSPKVATRARIRCFEGAARNSRYLLHTEQETKFQRIYNDGGQEKHRHRFRLDGFPTVWRSQRCRLQHDQNLPGNKSCLLIKKDENNRHFLETSKTKVNTKEDEKA